jgi:hypothetical protein
MMLSLARVIIESFGLPSIVMLGDRGEDRCRGLIMGWNGRDDWIPSSDVICLARICEGLNLRSRHPRTTGATTYLVWNGLLTN